MEALSLSSPPGHGSTKTERRKEVGVEFFLGVARNGSQTLARPPSPERTAIDDCRSLFLILVMPRTGSNCWLYSLVGVDNAQRKDKEGMGSGTNKCGDRQNQTPMGRTMLHTETLSYISSH
ncbi:uncharacterized protein [Aristolochia californica]|uniref:uncharacterized protein n=1 Tax=Aristolochia californica TaxID=171875 RepID=UPI0035D59AE0